MVENMTNPEPLAVTIPDACGMIGLGRTKLYAEIAAGRLEARKVGKRTLIPVASLRSWLSSLPSVEAA